MKRLTTKLIETALLAGWAALTIDRDPDMLAQEKKVIFPTIKTGEEATNHVGYKAKGYFAIEESFIMSYYYDFPESFWKWEEAIQSVLRANGYYMEPRNHCEMCIHSI